MKPADLHIANPEPQLSAVLAARRNRLVQAASRFSERLIELHGKVEDKYLAIAYFDEAHTLQQVQEGSTGRNPYFALMHVLSTIEQLPIFFIFLSTNSSLNALAPPDAHYPSL